MEKYIGENIKRARIKAGFTQEKLAERIDVSLSVISRLETGRTMVSVSKLLRIARVLNVSAASLLEQNPETHPYPVSGESVEDGQQPRSYFSARDAHLYPIDDELYVLIQQLPDKAKQYFKESLRCYLEIFWNKTDMEITDRKE